MAPWSVVGGGDTLGMNCSNGWFVSGAIDLSHGTGTFDRPDGVAYDSLPVPD